MSEIIPLETLQENESGRILDLAGPDDWRHRLEELGFRLGQIVQLVKRGEPCIVAINGHRLSYRAQSSTMVLVQALSAETESSS